MPGDGGVEFEAGPQWGVWGRLPLYINARSMSWFPEGLLDDGYFLVSWWFTCFLAGHSVVILVENHWHVFLKLLRLSHFIDIRLYERRDGVDQIKLAGSRGQLSVVSWETAALPGSTILTFTPTTPEYVYSLCRPGWKVLL